MNLGCFRVKRACVGVLPGVVPGVMADAAAGSSATDANKGSRLPGGKRANRRSNHANHSSSVAFSAHVPPTGRAQRDHVADSARPRRRLSGGPRVRSPDRQRQAIELGLEMPLIEYEPAHQFPGVIGRTADESSPAWPDSEAGPEGHAERVVHRARRHRASGSWAASAARSRRRTWTRSRANGLRYNNMHTTALCSPSRSCIITGRNHHSNAMACITEFADRLSRLRRQRAVRERLPVGDPARAGLQHLHGGQVAPDPEQPGDGGRARTTAGRSAVASSASTGSSAATRASGTPIWSTTTTRSNRRRRPRRATTSPPDLVDKAIAVHRRRQAGRPRQAVLPALLHRGDARAAPRAEGVGRQVRRQVRRRLGRLPHRGRSQRRRRSASCRPTASSPATTPTCRTGIR